MDKNHNDKKGNINRRDFLKIMGAGTITATAALYGCGNGNTPGKDSLPEGGMTYRQDGHGNNISLLGYGCMRWPSRKNAEGRNVLDQETINQLVDYAIAHGVNYFDTSPSYCR